jgi:hypothetical protein
MILISHKYPDRAQLTVVVFLAAMIAAMVESLTHQVFHFRALWLVLAFQEAMIFKMTTSPHRLERITRVLGGSPHHDRGFVGHPDVTRG